MCAAPVLVGFVRGKGFGGSLLPLALGMGIGRYLLLAPSKIRRALLPAVTHSDLMCLVMAIFEHCGI